MEKTSSQQSLGSPLMKRYILQLYFPSMARVCGRKLHTLMSCPPRREFYQADRRKKEDWSNGRLEEMRQD